MEEMIRVKVADVTPSDTPSRTIRVKVFPAKRKLLTVTVVVKIPAARWEKK